MVIWRGVERLAEALAALPGSTRAALCAGSLEVATAIALDDAGEERIRRWFTSHVGEGGAPTFVTDPSLIAGVELRAPHAVLRSNWAADLETLATEAAHDDGAV